MIHYATLADSPRLKRALAALERAGTRGLTTRELIYAADICAVNTVVAELRANGIAVDCVYEYHTATGARVYRYRLAAGGAV